MNRNVLSLIEKYHMISPGDHVICALSGGSDSMALLHVLMELKDRLGFTLSVAHLNHKLRGEDSDGDEAFVRSHCEMLNIPLFSEARDVASYAQSHHMGIEEAARLLRYEFLASIDPNAKIATAHTADDNLETLLMHILRGSGLHGLSGIPPVRDRIIRPLLTAQKKDIVAYLVEKNIPHREDLSNSEDFCLRNRLRHHVIPLLTEENPSLPVSASELCLHLAGEDAYMDEEANRALLKISEQRGLKISLLLKLPEALALRVLRLYLEDVPQLQRIHLEDALRLCRNSLPSAAISLPGGITLRREYDLLTTVLPDIRSAPEALTILPGQTLFFGPWKVTCTEGICPKILPKNTVALKPSGEYLLRSRLPGDRITLPGGTKKLSRYLIDSKIPASWRDTLPVVCVEGQPAAILPLNKDVKHCAEEGTLCVLFTAERMEEN